VLAAGLDELLERNMSHYSPSEAEPLESNALPPSW